MALASRWSSRMTNHISDGFPRRPVRPMRCRKPETVNGASIWNALSSLPISIPSSSVAVAQTDIKESSSFISSSALSRYDAERFPWWMRKRSGSCFTSQYCRRDWQTASHSSREFVKTRHFFPLVCSKMKPIPGSAASGARSEGSSGGGISPEMPASSPPFSRSFGRAPARVSPSAGFEGEVSLPSSACGAVL